MNPKHLRVRVMEKERRLWSFVDRSGGPDACWPYTGGKYGWGYGFFSLGAGKRRPAHRVAWEVTNGAIPEGMCILHICDNPPCCNPKHLRLGTQAENMADMARKGRLRGGPNAPRKPKPEKRPPQCLQCGRGFSSPAHRQCIAARSA